jgi:hypothetical protein
LCAFYRFEGWVFLDSFYFVFISMSTIGLGDIVPAHEKFMMALFIYLLFGLALTSMCINVVQVNYNNGLNDLNKSFNFVQSLMHTLQTDLLFLRPDYAMEITYVVLLNINSKTFSFDC